MSKPWEKYATQAPETSTEAPPSGPWVKYQAPPEDGGPDEPFSEKATRWGKNTLGALGKAAGTLRAGTIGPATGYLMEALSDKPGAQAFSAQDVKQAYNPTNLETFPSNFEMAKRTGLTNEPLLPESVRSHMAEKGEGEHWYTPEKGGALDITKWGLVEGLTDPATWIGGGEAGAAARTLESASTLGKLKQAARAANYVNPGNLVAKGVDKLSQGAGAATKALTKSELLSSLAKNAPETITNPLSLLTRGVGRTSYGATVRGVEHEGKTFGKSEVVDRLQQSGVWQPFGMDEKVRGAADTLLGEQKGRLSKMAEAGATVDMDRALTPGFAEVNRLRNLGTESALDLAAQIEQELQSVRQRAKGIPSTPGKPPGPPRFKEVESSFVDEFGRPIMTQERVPGAPGRPGTPGVPARPYTPQAANDLKSFWTSTLPQGTYKPAFATPPGARGIRNAAGGVKREIEDTAERVLGKGQGAELADINDALGTLVATKKSQAKVAKAADSQLDRVMTPTWSDGAIAGGVGGITGSPVQAAMAVLGKKAVQGAQLATMPTGLAVQKLGESHVLDRLNQIAQEKNQESILKKIKEKKNGKKEKR